MGLSLLPIPSSPWKPLTCFLPRVPTRPLWILYKPPCGTPAPQTPPHTHVPSLDSHPPPYCRSLCPDCTLEGGRLPEDCRPAPVWETQQASPLSRGLDRTFCTKVRTPPGEVPSKLALACLFSPSPQVPRGALTHHSHSPGFVGPSHHTSCGTLQDPGCYTDFSLKLERHS